KGFIRPTTSFAFYSTRKRQEEKIAFSPFSPPRPPLRRRHPTPSIQRCRLSSLERELPPRRRPSSSSYLLPSRRCSRPREQAIQARVHRKDMKKIPIPSAVYYAPLPTYSSSLQHCVHPRRRRIAWTAETPCRRAPFC
uniref:Uncharacterized protein n=1 Tax=Triticum urartu TaxID=4572 RepID=A0A8R7QJ92_TRIUA